jgi:hypothetical protein
MKFFEIIKEYENLFESHMSEIHSMGNEFRKIIAINSKACDQEKERANILLSKMAAAYIPCTFDNILISQSRGLETIRSTGLGDAIDLTPNGKRSCQIQLWSGMSHFESDPKKMHT